MGEMITLEVPDELARRVHAMKTATQRRSEDVVLDWLRRTVEEPPVDSLPDGELLATRDTALDPGDQDVSSSLLAGNREGVLDDPDALIVRSCWGLAGRHPPVD